MVGAPACEVGIEAPGHVRSGGAVAFEEGKGGDHGIDGRALMLSAEGREDGARADRRVEAFPEAFLRSGVEIRKSGAEFVLELLLFVHRRDGVVERTIVIGGADHDLGVLLHAIGLEKLTGKIDDLVASPSDDEAVGVSHGGDVDALEVFLFGLGDEIGGVGWVDTDSHALLRFGDGEFGAIEAVILFRNGIEIDLKAVGNFPNGD